MPITFGSFPDNLFHQWRTPDFPSFPSKSVPMMGFGSPFPKSQVPSSGLPSSLPVSRISLFLTTMNPSTSPDLLLILSFKLILILPIWVLQTTTFPTLISLRSHRPQFINNEASEIRGGDPVEWLNKAEQYFTLYQIPEAKQVSIASMHLIDEAADIWHLFHDEYPGTWASFSELFMKEFGGNTKIDYQDALV